MIHECYAEVSCDKCETSIYVQLNYVYFDYTGKNGMHDSEDSSIEKTLVDEHEWVVKNGKHFCCGHEMTSDPDAEDEADA
jgi:hypothetical protein